MVDSLSIRVSTVKRNEGVQPHNSDQTPDFVAITAIEGAIAP